MNISDILSIISTAGAAIAVYLAIRKQPHEIKKLSAETDITEADAAAKYQEIAVKSANRILELEKKITELQAEIDDLYKKVKILESENEQLKRASEAK